MSMFSKGIVLTQYKEPAFSRPLVRFVNPQTEFISLREPVDDTGALDAQTLIDIARAARIVDERDGKPLYRKLLHTRGSAVAVVVDAVDDEPYVSSKISPLLRLREEALGGITLLKKVAGTEEVRILCYKNITDVETRIPRSLEGYKITKLRGGYPARTNTSRLRLPKGKRLTVGVGALIHFYRAVTQHKCQTTVFITVCGNAVATPMNMEVSIGMTVMQVLERCGLTTQPTRVVCGGPMTGISIMDTERTLVTYTTRAILAVKDSKQESLYNCIGCGRCEQVCPRGLNPMYIYRFVENRYFANLKPFDAHLCTGCGTCSYICPSRLDVAAATIQAREYAQAHFVQPPVDEDEEEEVGEHDS